MNQWIKLRIFDDADNSDRHVVIKRKDIIRIYEAHISDKESGIYSYVIVTDAFSENGGPDTLVCYNNVDEIVAALSENSGGPVIRVGLNTKTPEDRVIPI